MVGVDDHELKLAQLGQQPPHQLLAAAADRADADAQAGQIERHAHPLQVAAQDDQRFGLRQPAQQFEPGRLREDGAILHQRKLHIAGLPGRDQPLQVLHRSGRRQVADLPRWRATSAASLSTVAW